MQCHKDIFLKCHVKIVILYFLIRILGFKIRRVYPLGNTARVSTYLPLGIFWSAIVTTTSIKALKMVDPSFWYWQVWHKVSLRGNFLNPMMIWPAVVVRTLSNQQPQFTMSSKRKLVLYFEKNL